MSCPLRCCRPRPRGASRCDGSKAMSGRPSPRNAPVGVEDQVWDRSSRYGLPQYLRDRVGPLDDAQDRTTLTSSGRVALSGDLGPSIGPAERGGEYDQQRGTAKSSPSRFRSHRGLPSRPRRRARRMLSLNSTISSMPSCSIQLPEQLVRVARHFRRRHPPRARTVLLHHAVAQPLGAEFGQPVLERPRDGQGALGETVGGLRLVASERQLARLDEPTGLECRLLVPAREIDSLVDPRSCRVDVAQRPGAAAEVSGDVRQVATVVPRRSRPSEICGGTEGLR